MADPVKVGIIGLGFMGRTHLAAYQDAAKNGYPVEVAAIHDPRIDEKMAGARGGNLETGAEQELDFTGIDAISDLDEFLARKDIDAVSICTPTDTHVDLAVKALDADKHCLVEKPLTLKPKEVRRLAEASLRAERHCLPAMCMRFWPGWTWLYDVVQGESYGRVLSARFERLGSAPTWNADFYKDEKRSGGALFDLHIHDADFVRWCFGDPDELTATGSTQHVTTLYHYDNGPDHVSAEGGWIPDVGAPFRMRYTVVFERAVADFELGREHPLLVYTEGETRAMELPTVSGYEGEIRHFIDVVTDSAPEPRATLEDAHAVARILRAERKSLDKARPEGL